MFVCVEGGQWAVLKTRLDTPHVVSYVDFVGGEVEG